MLSKQTQNNCSLRSTVSLQQCRVLWAGGHDCQGTNLTKQGPGQLCGNTQTSYGPALEL